MFERKDLPAFGEDRSHESPARRAVPASLKPQEYTVGFIFDPHFEIVALMRKNRPAWQAGKLNGIGGKFEAVDKNNPRLCMLREAKEEAVWRDKTFGQDPKREVELDQLQWKQFARITGKKNVITHQRLWVVHYFYATCDNPTFVVSREPEQPIEHWGVNDIARLNRESCHNVPWCLQMAVMCHNTGLKYDLFEIATQQTT